MMFGVAAAREKQLRQEALEEAADLFRSHGDEAIAILTAKIHSDQLSPDERRRARLARVEVERLHRVRRDSQTRALVVWKPSIFSWAGLRSLFGSRGKRGRGRGRSRYR